MTDLSNSAQAFLDQQSKPQLSPAAQEFLNARRSQQQASQGYANKFDPDQYADALGKSKQTGLPVDVVQRNPDQAAELIRAQEKRLQDLNKTPILQRFIRESPDFAVTSQGDLKTLSDTEGFFTQNFGNPAARGWENLKSSVEMNIATNALSTLDKLDAAFNMTDKPERALQIGLIISEAIRSPGPDTPMVLKYFDGTPEDRQQVRDDLDRQANRSLVKAGEAVKAAMAIPQNPKLVEAMQGDWTDLLSAVIKNPDIILQVGTESLVQTLPGLVAAPFTAGVSLGFNSFLLERGSKMQEILSEEGVDVSDPQAILSALKDPEKRSKIEEKATAKAIPVALFDTLSVGLAGVKLIPKTLTGVKGKVAEIAAQTTVQGVAGGTGEALGQLASEGEITSSADIALEAVAEIFGTVPEMATMSSQRFMSEYRQFKDAKKSAEILTGLTDLAANSKLAERSPEQFAEYVNNLAEASGNDTAYIDAKEFSGFFQSQNVDPQDAAEQLGVLKPYVEAMNAGGDVPIKLGDLLAQVAKKSELKSLMQHVRLKPGDLSSAEAVLWVGQQQNRMQEEADTILSELSDREAVEDSADRVQESIVNQLKATGMTEQTAQTNAALHRAFAITQSQRLGITPEQLYQRFGLTVTRDLQGDPAKALEQAKQSGYEGQDAQEASQWNRSAAKGLDMSKEARMERARAMGFDTGTVVYHGTNRQFSEFSTSAPKEWKNSDASKNGIHFTDSEDEASGYGKNVKAVFLNMKNPAYFGTADVHEFEKKIRERAERVIDNLKFYEIFDAKSDLKKLSKFGVEEPNLYKVDDGWTSDDSDYVFEEKEDAYRESIENQIKNIVEKAEDDISSLDELSFQFRGIGGLISSAKDSGHDGVIFDFNDQDTKSNHYVVFEPNQIRSINAAFDPDQSDSADLLAQSVVSSNAVDTLDQKNRGAIDLSNFPSNANIALLEDADLSSFLHETGHFFFEVMAHLAPENAEVRADIDALLKFTGFEGTAEEWLQLSIDERRNAHEKVAEAFEAYLFEGKAPSVELQGVFNRFRAWLIQVYKSLANMRVKLTDEVRTVFDRMIATQDEIDRAKQIYNPEPVFGTAKQAGMTEGEFNDYKKRAETSKQQAIDSGLAKAMRDIKRIINADRKEVREQIEPEVMARPEYQARLFFSRGENPPAGLEPVKLSKQAIEQLYGDDAKSIIDQLPGRGKYSVITSGDGITPDQAAPFFGFSSGDALIQSMIKAGDPKAEVDRLVSERIKQMYGELDRPGAIEELAMQVVHNSISLDVLAQEQRQLARQHNAIPMDLKSARAYASRVIAGKRIRDLRPQLYAQLAAKAGRKAEQALRANATQYRQAVETKQSGKAGPQRFKNNVEEAAYWKRSQILNELLFREAMKAREESEKIAVFMRNQAKPEAQGRIGKAGHTYLDQVNNILEQYEFKRVSNKELESRQSLREFVAGLDDIQQGLLAIPEEVLNRSKLVNYRDITLDELRGAGDAVKSVVNLAKLKNKLLAKNAEIDLDTARQMLADTIRTNANRTLNKTVEKRLPSEKLKEFKAGYLFSHRRLSSLAYEMDGGNDRGIVWDMIVRPLNEAGDNEAQLISEYNDKLVQAFKTYSAKTLRSMYVKKQIPGTNISLTKQAVLMMALNSGTEDNRTKMRAGLALQGITDADVNAALDTLTQDDWEFVSSIWNMINDLWPEIEAKEKRVNGVAPDKVEGIPVPTKFGTYAGKYFPLMYDDMRTVQDQAADIAKDMLKGAFTRSTTRRGHTKKRVEGVQRLIRLDFGVINQHLTQVIHDLTHHETLIDLNRLMTSQRVQSAILDHYGEQAYQTIKNAIKDVASGDVGATVFHEKALQHVRNGATIAGMGWNVGTALLQPLGYTNSIVRIGAKWVGVGLKRIMTDPRGMQRTFDAVKAQSKFMAERFNTQNREIADIRNKIKGSRFPAIEESFFWMITRAQMLVDVPTWIGAYEKSISEGATEADSIAFADQAVIDSQGGGQIKDLAQIQRGSPALKLFTNFISYFVTTYNLMAQRYRVTNKKSPAQVIALATDFILLYVVPSALGFALQGALKGFNDDDLEDLPATLAKNQLSFLLGGFFGLREFASAIQGYGYNGPPGARIFSEGSKLIQQAEQGELDEALLKAANNTAGILFHYPSGQVQRTVEGALGILEGDSKNPLELATGPRKD